MEYNKGMNRPVERISWDDICLVGGFLEQLNSTAVAKILSEKDDLQFRLPSEAMWEYAARGGHKSKGFPYAGSHKLKEVGWYAANEFRLDRRISHGETKPVGLKLPNELDLYDMSGNVREWCADWYDKFEKTPYDGSAWIGEKENTRRVVRGGSWNVSYDDCRVAYRNNWDANLRNLNIGFRLCRY